MKWFNRFLYKIEKSFPDPWVIDGHVQARPTTQLGFIIGVLITLIIIGLTGCVTQDTVVIDGCEYISTTSNTGNGLVESLTHKGNCNNPIHEHNK